MRCDLHVHSKHSGPTELPVLRLVGQESYSEPLEVYETARARGMDLVTLTDHDTIAGALEIAHLPGVFVSEEVTVLLPEGRQLHVNVFDVSEAQAERIAARRRDPEALFAYLAEERIPASVNHLFSAFTGARETGDLHLSLECLSLIETRNGSVPDPLNEYARFTSRLRGLAGVGGSDSHTLRGVARAFTTVPGAGAKEDFVNGLRAGRSVPGGRSGSYVRLTSEIGRIFASGYAAAAAEALAGSPSPSRLLALLGLLPLLPLIPLATAVVHLRELLFGERCFRALQASVAAPVRKHPWPLKPAAFPRMLP